MTLVTAIHDRAGIQIPVRDYPKLATANSFVAYLMSARALRGRRLRGRSEGAFGVGVSYAGSVFQPVAPCLLWRGNLR